MAPKRKRRSSMISAAPEEPRLKKRHLEAMRELLAQAGKAGLQKKAQRQWVEGWRTTTLEMLAAWSEGTGDEAAAAHEVEVPVSEGAGPELLSELESAQARLLVARERIADQRVRAHAAVAKAWARQQERLAAEAVDAEAAGGLTADTADAGLPLVEPATLSDLHAAVGKTCELVKATDEDMTGIIRSLTSTFNAVNSALGFKSPAPQGPGGGTGDLLDAGPAVEAEPPREPLDARGRFAAHLGGRP